METESAQEAPQEQQEAEQEETAEQTPPESSEAATEPEGEPTDELGRVRREAATRRVRLREVEAERDQLRTQLSAMQRAEVQRMAADRLADPTDLWRHDGVELEALLGEDGTPDREAVVKAVIDVVQAHPSWGMALPDLGQGPRAPVEDGPSFGQALKRAR